MGTSPSGFPAALLWMVLIDVAQQIKKFSPQRWTLSFHLREAAEKGSSDPLSSPKYCYPDMGKLLPTPGGGAGRGHRMKAGFADAL